MAERNEQQLIADGGLARVNEYVEGVISGEIVASKLVIAACHRHLNDLKRVGESEFPYYFDAAYAARVIQFFPMLLKHSIGKFAGLPFDLEPWQSFQVASVFGWKQVADDTRRFRKWYCSIARKNGKSTLAAGVAFFMTMADINPLTGKPESVAQTVLTATKKEQVIKVMYGEMQRMRNASPHLTKLSRNINQQFNFSHNDGQVICVGSDKPFDGLNPSLVVNDELHAWREHHREFYNTMTTGGAGREQPLQLITTTAGDDKSHIWDEEYTYCSGVCSGEIVDETVFAFVAELDEKDDPLDSANWIKANPNLGISVAEKYIEQAATEAASSAIKLNKFVRYHGNRKVSSTEKAFDLEKWDRCEGVLSDWAISDAVGSGVDLGARDDLAACAQVARFPIDERDGKPVYRFEIKVQSFIAEDTQRDIKKQPFFQWIYDGLLQKSRYPIADLRDCLIEKCSENGCRMVAYDPYNGQMIAEELKQEGLEPFRMAQNHSMFNEPIRDFLAAIDEGRIVHDGNPLLRWCVNNAALYKDRKDNWMFDKSGSGEKIDLIVAVVMAFRVACLAPASYRGKLFIN